MFSNFSAADAARLARIEQKLDLLMKVLGVTSVEPAASELPALIRAAADAGDKIEAIKRYRQFFGSSLRESKDAVEAYMNRNNLKYGNRE